MKHKIVMVFSMNLSKAQIALLSHFEIAGDLNPPGYRDTWLAVLNADPRDVIEEWTRSGILVPASTKDYAEVLPMKTLQTILRQANASHSGKKETLVERVLALGVDVMAYFPDEKLWICCDQLKPLITAYIEEEFQRKENTISSAKKALEEGDFSSLARIAAKYQTEDLFYGFSYTLASRHIAEHHPGEIERINEKAPSIDEVEKRLLRCFEPFQPLKKNRPAPFKDVPDELFERAIYSRIWPMLQINNTRFLKEDEEHIGEKLLQWLRSSGADI